MAAAAVLISVVVRGDRLRTSVSTQSSSKKYIFVKRDVLYDHRPTFHLIHRYCRLLGASSEGPTQLHAPNTISLLSRRGWPRPRAAGHMNIGESSKHWPKTPPWSRGRAAAPASFPSAVMVQKTSGMVSASARLLRYSPCSAYIHIPFCRSRCFYCDFPVHVVGDQGPSGSAAEAYGNPILLRS